MTALHDRGATCRERDTWAAVEGSPAADALLTFSDRLPIDPDAVVYGEAGHVESNGNR